MKILSAMTVDVIETFPSRFEIPFALPSAFDARGTDFSTESAISNNSLNRALTANQTGAIREFLGTFIPIVLKYSPLPKLISVGNYRMHRKEQRGIIIGMAVHAYLS
jgi:hypothetical protein